MALPLQRVPPPSLHGALAGRDMYVGAPALQPSVVQPLLSLGRSALSLTVISLPPMQIFFLQSPPAWPLVSVPSAVLLMPHTPFVQVRL